MEDNIEEEEEEQELMEEGETPLRQEVGFSKGFAVHPDAVSMSRFISMHNYSDKK